MECVVCFSPYDSGDHRPLCLPCGHSVCQDCVSAMSSGGRAFLCPSCRVEIREKTLEDFPVNFSLIGSTAQCQAAHEERKEEQPTAVCEAHPSKKVKFHCAVCDSDFCSKCVVRHTGDSHKIEDLTQAVDKKLDQLLLNTRAAEARLAAYGEELAQIETKNADMSSLKETLIRTYQDAIEAIRSEQTNTVALLDKAIQDNCTGLELAKAELTKRSQAFSEAQALVRTARHSVAKAHEKRASLLRAVEVFGQVWSAAEGKVKDFEPLRPTVLILARTNLPIKVAEVLPAEALSPAQSPSHSPLVPSPVPEPEEVKAPSLVRRKEAAKPASAKVSLPREVPKAKPKGPSWYYMSDNFNWAPYVGAQSKQIEEAFQAKAPTVDLGKYLLEFATMTQINKATKRVRRVGREIPAN